MPAASAAGAIATTTLPPRWCSIQVWAVSWSQVVDSAVLRFPKAVTHFSPGSYTSRPMQQTSLDNVFMAGDWVRGLEHGANGLSQVRTSLGTRGYRWTSGGCTQVACWAWHQGRTSISCRDGC